MQDFLDLNFRAIQNYVWTPGVPTPFALAHTFHLSGMPFLSPDTYRSR